MTTYSAQYGWAKPPHPDAISADAFKTLFRRHAAGVAVITLRATDRLVGFTATSVISVSADPPLLAFSVAGRSSSWPALQDADTLVVNFLAADQADLSARFATSGIDRFAGGGWSELPSGEPYLHQTPRWIRGEIVQRTSIGSSHLICVQAIGSSLDHRDASASTDAPPLVYHDRVYHRIDGSSAV